MRQLRQLQSGTMIYTMMSKLMNLLMSIEGSMKLSITIVLGECHIRMPVLDSSASDSKQGV